MNLPNTEDINLKESKAAFAFGLNCDVGEDGTKAEDILNLKFEHVNYIKEKHGIKNKTRTTLSVHSCNNSDFYYYYNNSLDRVNISKYLCLDKTDDIIEEFILMKYLDIMNLLFLQKKSLKVIIIK